MNRLAGWIISAAAIVLFGWIVSCGYNYKYRDQHRVTVTGLGEKEFSSDLVVWRGWLSQQSGEPAEGYSRLEESADRVRQFIEDKGIPAENVQFGFVNVNRTSEPIYGAGGNYMGSRYTGYDLTQDFTIESSDIDAVETVFREISSLIRQGITIQAGSPEYYYTRLDDLKLELIGAASRDARSRADQIARNSGSKIKTLGNARMGVFQITGSNSNEEFSAGGSFNTTSRTKKARITIRQEYLLK